MIYVFTSLREVVYRSQGAPVLVSGSAAEGVRASCNGFTMECNKTLYIIYLPKVPMLRVVGSAPNALAMMF